MKKFKFKLQPLLELTESLEKECKNKLAVINGELSELYNKRNLINDKIEHTKHMFVRSSSVNEFVNNNNYMEYLKKMHVAVNLDISIKEYEKAEIQADLVEHMKTRKIYEKLKEKKLEQYNKEVELENNKIIDDFLSNKGGE